MADSTPAAALDLDAVRRHIARAHRDCEPVHGPKVCFCGIGEPCQDRATLRSLVAEVEKVRAELAEVTRQRDEAHVTIRAFVDDLDGGEWTTRQGWMNRDRFQTYTSSAEGFLPPTGPTHQQRIWTGPVEEIKPAIPPLDIRVVDTLPPGRVMMVSRVGTAPGGIPIVSAVAVDVDPPEAARG